MNEKPKPDPRNFRPAFFQEKQNAEIALDAGMRTCIGYQTIVDEQGEKKISETVCENELPKGLRDYCSGWCMENAKKRGTYRSD